MAKSKVSFPITTGPIISYLGRGLDIGTANIACCWLDGTSQKFKNKAVRDCFLTLPIGDQNSLQAAGVEFHISKDNEHLIVLGLEAAKLASIMGITLRRPLAAGFISDKEDLSKEVVKLILFDLLGKPKVDGELVVYSIPGLPINNDTVKAQFHTRFFYDRIKELHYTPLALNEAVALGYHETLQVPEGINPLTGFFISLGAGMINLALVFKSIPVRTFSLPVGGDFIDESAAKATNSPVAQVTLLKEEGLDLKNGELITKNASHDTQTDRQVEALCLMYKELLTKLRDGITEFFSRPENRVAITEELPVIISGGTALAKGFLSLFDEIVLGGIDVRFPLAKNAIQTNEPLTAVSIGALKYARLRSSEVVEKEGESDV